METDRTFYRRASRGRVVACLVITCLLDAGVVVAGYMHPEWFERNKPFTAEVEFAPDEPPPPELVVPEDYNPDEATPEPTPEETPEPDEETPPPPEPETQFVDPTPSPTPDKPKVKPKFSGPIPEGAKRGPEYVPGVVGGKPGGSPGGKIGGQGWRTPQPPYSAVARQKRLTGSGTYRVTTDAGGNVTSVTVVQSAALELDAMIKNGAPGRWKGPPNQTTVIPVTFRLQ